MYLAALLADFQINGGVNQILLHGGAFSSSEVLGKNTSIQSKLLTPKLAGLKRKESKAEANQLCASSDFGTTCKSRIPHSC